MKSLIPQREHFSGPERLSPAWTLTKGKRTATCEVWSNQFGFELRPTVAGDDFPRTQVCRTQPEMIALVEKWRVAFSEKGWT